MFIVLLTHTNTGISMEIDTSKELRDAVVLVVVDEYRILDGVLRYLSTSRYAFI